MAHAGRSLEQVNSFRLVSVFSRDKSVSAQRAAAWVCRAGSASAQRRSSPLTNLCISALGGFKEQVEKTHAGIDGTLVAIKPSSALSQAALSRALLGAFPTLDKRGLHRIVALLCLHTSAPLRVARRWPPKGAIGCDKV